jgi:hypothetical protein
MGERREGKRLSTRTPQLAKSFRGERTIYFDITEFFGK